MSISVKNINVSIAGNRSDKFKIQLDGAQYRMDQFRLTQQLLYPCHLEFIMYKDPAEDANEPQFTVCNTIIGKEITLTLSTESMEQGITGANTEGKNEDIEFEGFIMSARAQRDKSRYVIHVDAYTKDVVLEDAPYCKVYNETKLDEIVKSTLDAYKITGSKIASRLKEPIFYTCRFYEKSYDFLRRLACRHGEWLYNTGKGIFFGNLSDREVVQLSYPSQDIPYYGIRMDVRNLNRNHVSCAYNERRKAVSYNVKEQYQDTESPLLNASAHASFDIYKLSLPSVPLPSGMESDDDVDNGQDNLNKPVHSEEYLQNFMENFVNAVVYEGKTFCSKLRVGYALNIKDNFISSADSNEKSQVNELTFTITRITHSFTASETYSNLFEGVTGKSVYPPYHDATIYPVCNHPVRAVVTDTEDPKKWGRVKVRFLWQGNRDDGDKKNKVTPWIFVAQPYNWQQDDGRYAGTHVIPDVDSTVIVDFENGNAERPYVRSAVPSMYEAIDEAWYEGKNTVKAIRTRSGHTIEIHDKTDGSSSNGGFIKIYDHKADHYIVTLSTDQKLIKLESAGDIVLTAKGNITMKAGAGVNVSAGGEISESAGSNISQSASGGISSSAGGDISQSAGGNLSIDAGGNMVASAGDDMDYAAGNTFTMTAGKDLIAAASNDLHIVADNEVNCYSSADFSISVGKNLNIDVTDSTSFSSKRAIELKAMDIKVNADNGLAEYSVNHEVNAKSSIKLSATATIDIKAMLVKEN